MAANARFFLTLGIPVYIGPDFTGETGTNYEDVLWGWSLRGFVRSCLTQAGFRATGGRE
jgi:hypothetical protein